ncbi:hypothetical protein GQ649_32825 [Rhodococcus sp. DSM 6344]|nr:hypothetical protein [Rhodococcus erythropolis]
MHSSATAQILDHTIDHARFGVRFHNGEVSHDTLQKRYQRLLTAQGFNQDTAELKKLRRNITQSSIRYQQYRVAVIMAPFLAFFALTIVKVAAEESMPQIYLMLVVVAGFAYVVWRDYPRGLAMEHAQKADRILVGFEAPEAVDSEESTGNAIEWSSRIPMTSSRANTEKNRLLTSLLFGEAVRAGNITTNTLHDRYLAQRSRTDAATHARELRAIKRNLALTDVPRLRLLILATFAILSAAAASPALMSDQSLLSTLMVAALVAVALYAVLRLSEGKSPVTAMATGLALSNGQRADTFLAELEQNQNTDNR